MDDKLACHTHALDNVCELGVRVGVSERVALRGRVPAFRQNICSREI